MPANYDKIAGNYDRISRMIFRNSIVEAQQSLLHFIVPPCNVLIVGGGTGWILEEIVKIHPTGIKVTYIDSSAKMIRLARQKDFGANQVTFVHGVIENYTSKEKFDAVMTPFLFDNFRPEKAEQVFKLLDGLLCERGIWLFADFLPEGKNRKTWQNILLKLMYRFFRVISTIEADHLQDTEFLFSRESYEMVNRSYHFHGFIESTVYRKS